MKRIIRNAGRTAAALLAVFLLVFCCGCGQSPFIERSGFYFDTYITVRVYCSDESVMDGVFGICEEYDRMFSSTNAEGDVWAINHADGQPVEVSPEIVELLELAKKYYALSDGRFDVSCGSLTALWDFESETPILPSNDEIQNAVKNIGIEKITVSDSTVCVRAGTQLDFGGIAKGYIADKIADYLSGCGVDNALINLGGNVVVLGSKSGSGYRIGVQSPFGDDYIEMLNVSDCSVVTAGTYQRGFELDGAYYHHLLDLSTGMPAETGLAAVTVISPHSADGDALATSLFLLGAEKGSELAESLEHVEALFVFNDGEIQKTSGFDNYVI